MIGRPLDVVASFVQKGEGVLEGGKAGRVSQREGSLDRRMLLSCANPACKKGGFLLRQPIESAIAEQQTSVALQVPCAGYVGPLRREKGRPPQSCGNTVEVEITISYR
ncbi:hypothetical protein ACFL59_02045 [Planctomycetota bacterium]